MSVETRTRFQLPGKAAPALEGQVITQGIPVEGQTAQPYEAPIDGGQSSSVSLEGIYEKVDKDYPVPTTGSEIGRLITSPDPDVAPSVEQAASMFLQLGTLKREFTEYTAKCNEITPELRAKGDQRILLTREARDHSQLVKLEAQRVREALNDQLAEYDKAIETYEAATDAIVGEMDSRSHVYADTVGPEGDWVNGYIERQRPDAAAALDSSSAFIYGTFRDLYRYRKARDLLIDDLDVTTRDLIDADTDKSSDERELKRAENSVALYQEVINTHMKEAKQDAELENLQHQPTELNASLMDEGTKQEQATKIVLERIRTGEYDVPDVDGGLAGSRSQGDTRTVGQVFVDEYNSLTDLIEAKKTALSKSTPSFDKLSEKSTRLQQELRDLNAIISDIENAVVKLEGYTTLAQVKAELKTSEQLVKATEKAGKAKLDGLAVLESEYDNLLNKYRDTPEPEYEPPVPAEETAALLLSRMLVERGVNISAKDGGDFLHIIMDKIATLTALENGNPNRDPAIDDLLGRLVLAHVKTDSGLDIKRDGRTVAEDLGKLYTALAQHDATPVKPPTVEPTPAEASTKDQPKPRGPALFHKFAK